MLGTPELNWLIERARRRIEQGLPLTGAATLTDPTAAQQQAIARLLGRPAGRGRTLSVRMAALDEEIRDAEIAPDLRTAVEVIVGPMADLIGEKADEAQRRAAMIEALRRGAHAGADWYDAWSEALAADGTLTRLLRRGDERLAGEAASVLGRLPADDLPLPVLAELVTGNTKALSGTPLAGLVVRALAMRDGRPVPTDADHRRAVWESAGVVLDDLSSHVLVLNVVGNEDHVVCDWLRDASAFGIPFRLTLHQLRGDPFTPDGRDIFVCENPAVLRVAAAELAQRCAPLICTEGQPSAACRRLLTAAARAGVALRWRGDFDWTGLRTTSAAIVEYGATPWQMALADYVQALESGESEPLRGAPADSTWDGGALSRRMHAEARAVMEERMLPRLIPDLAANHGR